MYFATNDVHVPRFLMTASVERILWDYAETQSTQFDWTVGQLMETLDQLGLTENTLIILSSDNGPVVDDGYKDKAEELLNGHTPSGPWRGEQIQRFRGWNSRSGHRPLATEDKKGRRLGRINVTD